MHPSGEEFTHGYTPRRRPYWPSAFHFATFPNDFRRLPSQQRPRLSAQDENNFTLEGKITEKTAGKLTVSTGENMIFHVLYNDKTEIKKKDGSPGTAQDLHTGLTNIGGG